MIQSRRSSKAKDIQESELKNVAIFLLIPLVTIVIAPGLNDAHGYPKLIALVLGTFFLALNIKIKRSYSKLETITSISIFVLTLWYLIVQIALKNDFISFLIGGYLRGGGFIAWLAFSFIFYAISRSSDGNKLFNGFLKSLKLTNYLLLFFAAGEILEILPFKVKSQYEGSTSLTLTNPNFASSFLAILAIVNCYEILYTRGLREYKSYIILIANLYLIYKTNSIQGFVVFFIGLTILTIIKALYSKARHKKRKVLLFGILPTFLIFILLVIVNYSWIVRNGSINQRISYWKLAIEIWTENKLFGVGLENMRDFVPRLRSQNFIEQEGLFTIPDRAHNVFLDHLVSGGLIAFVLWMFFVVTISLISIYLVIKLDNLARVRVTFATAGWFGYVFQSSISVDHLALTTIGMICAGLITNEFNEFRRRVRRVTLKPLNDHKAQFYCRKPLRFASYISLAIFIVFSIPIINFDRNAYRFLKMSDFNSLSLIVNSRIVIPQALEEVMVKVSQDKNFTLADKLAEKLLIHRKASHQAYYVKSVYLESKGNLVGARDQMLAAQELDPLNTIYILSLGIFELNLGNLEKARIYAEKVRILNPDQQGLFLLERALSQKQVG